MSRILTSKEVGELIDKAIESLDWSQAEFGVIPDQEDFKRVIMPIIEQQKIDYANLALNYVYGELLIAPKDSWYGTLSESIKKFKEVEYHV